jgi:hypothetical protein
MSTRIFETRQKKSQMIYRTYDIHMKLNFTEVYAKCIPAYQKRLYFFSTVNFSSCHFCKTQPWIWIQIHKKPGSGSTSGSVTLQLTNPSFLRLALLDGSEMEVTTAKVLDSMWKVIWWGEHLAMSQTISL